MSWPSPKKPWMPRARRSTPSHRRSAQAAAKAIEDMEQYLKVTAPFDGVIIERNVHPGALVGRGGEKPMFDLEQISRLRLVVAVPELDVAAIPVNAHVTFTVPAHP